MKKPKTDKFADFKPTDKAGKKAAVYVRVSRNEFKTKVFASEKEAEKELRESVITQIQNGKTFCQNNNWDYEIYDRDSGQSGFDGEETRQDLQRLVRDIEQGKIHTVITREHWRVSRNAEFTEKFINLLFNNGVDYIGLDEPIDIKTPDGQMMLGIKGRMGQNYLSYISKKSKSNKTYLASKGGLITVGNCLGYKHVGKNKVEIVPDEAKVIKWLFESRSKGFGLLEIARQADKLGYRTKTGTKFGTGNLTLFFKNPRYTGHIRYNGKIIPSPYPKIIEFELWEKCQEFRSKAIARHDSNRLSKILKCGVCGTSMSTRTCNKLRYYQCYKSQSPYNACKGKTTFRTKEIWDFIDKNIGIFASEHLAKLANMSCGVSKDAIDSLENELIILMNRKDKLSTQYAIGNLSDDAYSSAFKKIEEMESKTKSELLKCQSQVPSMTKVDFSTWIQMTEQEKNKALKTVLDKIEFHGDFIKIFPKNVNIPFVVKREPMPQRNKYHKARRMLLPQRVISMKSMIMIYERIARVVEKYNDIEGDGDLSVSDIEFIVK